VAGSRTIKNDVLVKGSILEFIKYKGVTEIIHGDARGVDHSAGEVAKELHLLCKIFLANWDKHGKGAGPIRNKKIDEYGDALCAVWDKESHGTKHMIRCMKSLGKLVSS